MATLNEKLNLPPEYKVEDQSFRGLYRFNTKPGTYLGYDHCIYYYVDHEWYWDIEGKWGCVDETGNIVIEPIYDNMLPLDVIEDHIIVGKIENNKLKCGLLDWKGNEVIPCKYLQIHDVRNDNAVAFSHDREKYGLMDLKENVIIEPTFRYIDYYNAEHRLIVLGAADEPLSLYSIDLGKVVLPPLYDYFEFQETGVECELYNDTKFEFYRYEDLK